ncbi:MAG: alpha/beta fold hydrolase [Chloroflexi bacterium]|nr:alpha/beta fold hydrolase [Chloroflexota bacterium]
MAEISTRLPGRTGRRKAWAWAGRITLGVIALPFLLMLLGFVYQSVAEAADASTYPPPGQRVDVGGYRLHIYCTGAQQAGAPTVILESLFPGTVSNWAWVQPEIAKVTRVCAYDRAGHGWSDPGPEPRDARQHAHELHALLQNANVAGPYVLVGHSLGGLFVRMYATLYPAEVAGMVLLEGSHPDLPPRQFEELRAYFNTARYMETLRAVNAAFPAMLAQVRGTGRLGAISLAVVVGTASENASGMLFDLQQQLATLSDDSILQKVEGATHGGLADQREHALQTSAVILRIVEAVRTGQSLQ